MSSHEVTVDEPLYTIEHYLPHKTLTVYPISDVHIGAHGHAQARFKACIKAIAAQDESHRILLMGDLADIAIKQSVGFSHGAATPQWEQDALLEALKPVADRVDLIIEGNHERRISKAVGLNYTQNFSALLGRPQCYRPAMTAVRYRFAPRESGTRYRGQAVVLCHHGWGGGRTPGAKINKAGSLIGLLPTADVFLMGHLHEQMGWTTTTTVGWPPRKKVQRVVITGTHLGPEKYGMDYGFRPSAIGCPVITMASDRNDNLKTRVEL